MTPRKADIIATILGLVSLALVIGFLWKWAIWGASKNIGMACCFTAAILAIIGWVLATTNFKK